ncbi:MAG: hypothetical protein LC800_18395 [Acidobacteria bacterium]|nr:hypothetical protein [Acidobacteriota bacterium]
MPNLRPRLLPATALLILAALSCAPETARAQETSPAPPAAASKIENSTENALSGRGPAATPPARAREDAVFFTGATRSREDLKRLVLFSDTLSARAVSAHQSGDADDSATTTPQTQASAPAPYTPLTSEQKMRRAAKSAFLNPGGYARVAFSSIWTQWNEDSQPHKTTEDEVADGASRFAINFGRRATRSLLGGGVFPILFRQDPRYERAEEGTGAGKRAAHAVSRVFVTRGDGGGLRPNVSNWAGSLSASALSNLWERSTPGHDRIGADATFKRFANTFLNDAINNLVREFWPDIKKIFER